MAFGMAQASQLDGGWGTIAALVSADGSTAHPVAHALTGPAAAIRDVADAIHALCMLHGRHPGAIDHAAASNGNAVAEAWLAEAAHAFTVERGYLAQLTAAAGPLPSTPGQAETEAAILAQRHALDMLAQSGRAGCAIGASIALVLDWRAIRAMLDAAALRLGVLPAWLGLPLDADTMSLVAALTTSPGIERAMIFGAQQVLAQHRALWDLLDARKSARDDL
jgi:hypothetical protein